jgi:hypothetical protein
VKVTADQYGEICDVVERNYHGWPLTEPEPLEHLLHTSKEARAATNRIIEILGLEIQDLRDIGR